MTVYVLNAPPCSGKSTYVKANALPDDVVIDYDTLSQALGSSRGHGHAPHFDAIVGKARWAAIKAALEASRTHGVRVWIIDSCIPDYRMRAYEDAHAEFVRLDVDKATLHARAEAERPPLWHALIDDWAPLLADAGPSWKPHRERERKPWPKRPAYRKGAHGYRYEKLRAAFLAGRSVCEACHRPFVTDAPCQHRKCVRRSKGCIYHPRYPTVDHSVPLVTGAAAPLDMSLWRALCAECNQSAGGKLARARQLGRAQERTASGSVDLNW